MSGELNDLTRRLYAQGYTRNNFPDTVCWNDWQNFGYKWETMLQFTWETPCGLLIQGDSDVGRGFNIGDCWFQNVWYCPENDNPLLCCPYQRKGCEHIPQGLRLIMCPCHQTKKPYDYEKSVEKIEREQAKEAHKQYMELTGGAYCACVVGGSGCKGGWYEVKYNVEQCIRQGCKNPVCAIRKQPRNLKKVNIFYDIEDVLGFQVKNGEVIEIDDGLVPYYFHVCEYSADVFTHFDRDRARKNKLEKE